MRRMRTRKRAVREIGIHWIHWVHWIHNNISRNAANCIRGSSQGGDSSSIQRQSHGIHSRLACKSRLENPLFPLSSLHGSFDDPSFREGNFKLTPLETTPLILLSTFVDPNFLIFLISYDFFFFLILQTKIKENFNISRCKNLSYLVY